MTLSAYAPTPFDPEPVDTVSPVKIHSVTQVATCSTQAWILVKGCNLSYQKKEPMLFTADPNDGNLN